MFLYRSRCLRGRQTPIPKELIIPNAPHTQQDQLRAAEEKKDYQKKLEKLRSEVCALVGGCASGMGFQTSRAVSNVP
jgi:sulfite reductase beta subunit-like hemoprotein